MHTHRCTNTHRHTHTHTHTHTYTHITAHACTPHFLSLSPYAIGRNWKCPGISELKEIVTLSSMAPQTGEHRGNRWASEQRLWGWGWGRGWDGSHHEVESYFDFRLPHAMSWPLSLVCSVLQPPLTTVIPSCHMTCQMIWPKHVYQELTSVCLAVARS